jgi:hypothetical protein
MSIIELNDYVTKDLFMEKGSKGRVRVKNYLREP